MPATAPTSPTPQAPADGQPITMKDGRLLVPAIPIVPFIEGDGTGPDIWRASQRVFDAAVQRAYGGSRRIAWMEVLAGEKAKDRLDSWLSGRSSTCTPASGRCAGSRGCRRRSRRRRTWTW